MPCWYYEKRDLRYTPSYKDGIDPETEARYRREGARFIIDTGTKMGLRYDTCATGVVYFHRFYMFHSFREFHRYVTGACCLFLAGKVEETPKKCKDIIKNTKSMLTEAQFAVFGEDSKGNGGGNETKAMEEVMTLERILLQTIKFDLQVAHPYAYLLRYAKVIKGDKAKIQKLIQMAWTFINDSMCTTLCLQWEPDIISVALMYLASRLSKFDITDYHGKTPGSKIKWWEFLVDDATMDLLEDICHQVLDLYSAPQAKREDSPPMSSRPRVPLPAMPPAPQPMPAAAPAMPPAQHKRSRSVTPQESGAEKGDRKKSGKRSSSAKTTNIPVPPPVGVAAVDVPPPASLLAGSMPQTGMSYSSTFQQYQSATSNESYSSNPFMPSNMTASSFLSTEGAQSIQTLIGGGTTAQQQQQQQQQQQAKQQQAAKQQVPYSSAAYQPPPPSDSYSQAQYNQQVYQQQPAYQQGYGQQQSSQQGQAQQPVAPAQQGQMQTQQANYNYQQTAYPQQQQQQQQQQYGVANQQQFPVGTQQYPVASTQQQFQAAGQQQFPASAAQTTNPQQFPVTGQPGFPPTSQSQFSYQNQTYPAQNVQNQYIAPTNAAYPAQPASQQPYTGQTQSFPQMPQAPPPQFPPQPPPQPNSAPPQQQFGQQPFQQPPPNFPPMPFPASTPSTQPQPPPVQPLMSANVRPSGNSSGIATRITGARRSSRR
ncbi:cyclin-K-like isoform X2 [Lineus longissimus]|uniref:cyclin-K-like isoform X2 n=1 Tax=Lineus longissimus TaxID=88925 RepID=UPI00315CFA0B